MSALDGESAGIRAANDPGGTTTRPRSFLQSGWWLDFKSRFGWSGFFHESGGPVPVLVMERPLAAGYTFAYVPHGPETSLEGEERDAMMSRLASELKAKTGPRCVFVRFDPPWYRVEGEGMPTGRPLPPDGFRKAAYDVQPPDTVIVDLSGGEEAVVAGMKPKWRYNARLAEKKGVEISHSREATADDIARFYSLYEITAARDAIALHPPAYYRTLFEVARERKVDLRLWFASHEGDTLASIVTVFHGGTATYLYGASSDEKRNLMPAYALQWAAMREAIRAGCAEYDLYGIPPTDDEGHAMHGLYRFKTGFGGRIIHRPGSWDHVCMPVAYAVFVAAEKARTFYHKTLKKRLVSRRG